MTAGANTTVRVAVGGNAAYGIVDTNSAQTPAGSKTLNIGGLVSFALNIGSFAPVASPTGPTTIKTWDGVTQSTGIKTYFGVDLANVKTINGAS